MLQLFIIILCLILNAILSCVEMAFVTASKPHLRKMAKDGDVLAKRLLVLRANPERVLSVLQIGITMVGAVSAAVGGASAEEYLSPKYEAFFGVSEKVAEIFSIISVVLPITYFSVVIGELVPKTLALRSPMKFARFGAMFLIPLDKIFAPIVYVLEFSTKLLVAPLIKRLGSESVAEQAASIDLDALTDTHKQYILNLISFDKKKIKDIIVPWNLVTKIDYDFSSVDVLNLVRSSRYTRIPVIKEEQPVGILYVKDFISESEMARLDWHQLIRPIVKVKAEDPILTALRTLQSDKSHLAIVTKKDEYVGIITLEDVMEEVIGEIYDEDDDFDIKKLLSSNSKLRGMNIRK